jgi:Pvc16 N-terminal domain
MFQDLDATLAALVGAELDVRNVDLSFAAPDSQFPPTGVTLPAVSLFLYDVRENQELRTNQWELEQRDDGVFTRQRPPVRVGCSYLITAWPSDTTDDPSRDEHLLLGEVMKVLLRHRTIPATYLRGELVGHEPPVRARVLAENQLQSLGELWQAMGGKPKTALHYGLTLSVDVFEPREVGPEVKEKVIALSTLSPGTRPG